MARRSLPITRFKILGVGTHQAGDKGTHCQSFGTWCSINAGLHNNIIFQTKQSLKINYFIRDTFKHCNWRPKIWKNVPVFSLLTNYINCGSAKEIYKDRKRWIQYSPDQDLSSPKTFLFCDCTKKQKLSIFHVYMGQIPQDGNFGQNVCFF